jgi:DNA-directed RNA polymerase alpha subunit
MKRWLRRWLGIEDVFAAEVEKAKAEIGKARDEAKLDIWTMGMYQKDGIKAQVETLAEHDASFIDRVVESINRKQLK